MTTPKLTIIIPVFNERATLPLILERVLALDLSKQVLIVDDVSTDGTREWLLQEQSRLERNGARLLLQPVHGGKGCSVRRGIQEARGKYLIVQDGDLEYTPEEIPTMLQVAESGHPVVYGSRLLKWPTHLPTPVNSVFMVGRIVINAVFRLLYGQPTTDIATCYKLVRSDIAQALPLRGTGFELDFEITALLARLGYRIREVPISYSPRSIAEGKKLRVRDGWRALRVLVQCRFQRLARTPPGVR